jgi:hypothetical protein
LGIPGVPTALAGVGSIQAKEEDEADKAMDVPIRLGPVVLEASKVRVEEDTSTKLGRSCKAGIVCEGCVSSVRIIQWKMSSAIAPATRLTDAFASSKSMPHSLFHVNNTHSKNSAQDPKKATLSHPLGFQPKDAWTHLVVDIHDITFFEVVGEASWTRDLVNCQVPECIREASVVCLVWVGHSKSCTVCHYKVQDLLCIVFVRENDDLDDIILIWNIAHSHIIRPQRTILHRCLHLLLLQL